MLVHAECIAKENKQGRLEGGYLRLTKVSRPAIFDCMPKPDEQVTVRHGELLAAWCAGTPTAKPGDSKLIFDKTDHSPEEVERQFKQTLDEIKSNLPAVATLKRQLWDLTSNFHFGSKTKLNQWLIDEMFITPEESLSTLTEKRLSAVIEAINHKLTTK